MALDKEETTEIPTDDVPSSMVKLQSTKPPFLTVEVDPNAEPTRYARLLAARWKIVPANTPLGKRQKAGAAGPGGQKVTQALPRTTDPALNAVAPEKLTPAPAATRTGTGGRGAKNAKGAGAVVAPVPPVDDDGLGLLDQPPPGGDTPDDQSNPVTTA